MISSDFMRDVFEIAKVQTENNISQHLDKFACCYNSVSQRGGREGVFRGVVRLFIKYWYFFNRKEF